MPSLRGHPIHPVRSRPDAVPVAGRAVARCRLLVILAWLVTCLGWFGATPAQAATKTFVIDSVNQELDDCSADILVLYRSFRLNRASELWNVEVVLVNRSETTFSGPLLLFVEQARGTGGPADPDGWDDGTPPRHYYNLTDRTPDRRLMPAAATQPRTLALAYTAGAQPSLETRVYGRRGGNLALALTRSLDATGHPLPGVEIFETGPQDSGTLLTDPEGGWITLGRGPGQHTWQFRAPGYLPVWRRSSLVSGQTETLEHPRLTRRSTDHVTVTPSQECLVSSADGSVQIRFPAAAFVRDTAVTLTPLTGQILPALLPAGWSPLQAFCLETETELLAAAASILRPWGPIYGGETAALVRWDPVAFAWVVQVLTPGQGTRALSFSLERSGTWALVVPDSAPTEPPVPTVGQPLPAVAFAFDRIQLTASGAVEPASSSASRIPARVTATARLTVVNPSAALPSGLWLRGAVREEYRMRDGWRRVPPLYEQSIVAYQRPGDTDPATVHSSFPMRPIWLFDGEELAEATVRVDLLAPAAFAGGIVEPGGGEIATADLRLVAGSGTFSRPQAVQLRSLDPAAYAGLVEGTGARIAHAFELCMAPTAPGRQLLLQTDATPPNAVFVLARVRASEAWYGLEPRQRLASDAQGRLASLEPEIGERLPGLTGSGQYLLVQVPVPQGLIAGVARNSQGEPVPGLPVRPEGQPWLALTEPGGRFQLVAPAGPVDLAVLDPDTGDAGLTTAEVIDPRQPLMLELATEASGPRVLATLPEDGGTGASRVSPVVVIFSEPIHPDTLGAEGIRLLDAAGQVIPAQLTLSLLQTRATLLPAARLAASATYTLVVAPSLADLTGLPLEGPNTFTFTTEPETLDRSRAQLTSYEPDIQGMAGLAGSPGTAEAESPVILVNETTGYTATVLSRIDGSFTNSIPADVDDELSAVVVNANGTRNVIPVSRQIFRDGTVGLFRGGGILEAQSEQGPLQVVVPPGSIPNKTRFKVETILTDELRALVDEAPPGDGKILGGFRVGAVGDEPTESLDVVFPVDVSSLGLPPGSDPAEASFVLAAATQVDGVWAYHVLDKMDYEDGRLVTHSLPFLGLAIFTVKAAWQVAEISGYAMSPDTALQEVMLLPIFLSARKAYTVFGYAAQGATLDQAGRIEAGTGRVLPGTVVTLRPVERPFPVIPGRLDPGSLFSVTDGSGKYSLRIGIQEFSGFILTATHPTIPGQRQTRAIPNFTLDQPYARADIVFPFATGSADDHDGPLMDVSHTPFRPPTGGTAELRVRLSDASPSPHLAVSVLSAVESISQTDLPLGVVTATHVRTETVSASVMREFYEIASATNTQVRVQLELVASDAAGNQSQLRYPIWFGGSDPDLTNAVVSYDASDVIGPVVAEVWPPSGSTGLTLGSAIQVRFNEPIDRSVLTDPGCLSLSPSSPRPALELSADQTILSLVFPALDAGTAYSLTLSSAIRDLRGNRLDQDPAVPGESAFTCTFTTAPNVRGLLAGIESGGGVILRGIYAYALERKGSDYGSLRVFDLSEPAAPRSVASFRLPPFPRDLVLIPDYGHRLHPAQPARTHDLLAVVGGLVGGLSIMEGGTTFGAPWLRVIDISNPANPVRVAGARVNLDPTVAITRVRWSPPNLGYLETSPDLCSIGVVNLQALILSEHLGRDLWNTYPVDGLPGRDANADGDYVDPGDELPIPSRLGSFAGKVFAYLLPDTHQWINDFTLDFGGGAVTLAVQDGFVLDANGRPTVIQTPPAFRYLFKWGYLDRNVSSHIFTNGTPTRVTFLPGTPVRISNSVSLLDLALVTLRLNSGTYQLTVFDATDPAQLRVLSQIQPVRATDILYGVHVRDDGLLALATSQDLLLLDPLQLAAQPPTPNSVHPAIVGTLPGAGAGNRTLSSTSAGLSAVSLLGNNRLVQSSPRLRFVSFPNLIEAASLVDDPTAIAEAMNQMLETTALHAVRLKTQGEANSTASPPNPDFHYYVWVDAPGSAGATIELGLESLNRAGTPLQNRGRDFAPVRALTATTLAGLGQTPRAACDAPIRPLTAHRLSSNPASPFYNVYLSKPFCVTCEKIAVTDLLALQTELDREILWAGHSLRAILDPLLAANAAVGPFAAQIDRATKIISPGAAALVETLPGTYLMGPNPPPVGGHAEVPGTFGTVSAHNGEFRHDTVDLALPGRRLPIVFQRFIGGQDLYDGPFGRGWDFNYNQNLTELRPAVFAAGSRMPLVGRSAGVQSTIAASRDVLFHNGEGRVVLFTYRGDSAPPEVASDPLVIQLGWDGPGLGYYLPEPGSFDLLFRFPGGQFVRLTPDGEQYWYSTWGRLEKVYDRYPANQLAFSYNTRGELVAITDKSIPNDARFLRIGYWRLAGDALFVSGLDEPTDQTFVAGNICRLKDHAGRDVRFHYNADGVLDYQEGVQLSGANGGFSGRARTTYLWTDNCSAVPQGIIAGAGNLGAPLFVAALDDEAVANGGQGAFGAVQIMPPPVNEAAALSGSVSTSVGPSGEKTEFTFDARGYPARLKLSGPSTNQAEFANTCNDQGQPEKIVYPEGNSVSYVYDTNNPCWRSRGNLVSVRKDPGPRPGAVLSASFHYDPRYNLLAGAQNNANGHTLAYTLTTDGRDIARIEYPGAGTQEFSYDPTYGQLLAETSPDGQTARYTYDSTTGFRTEEQQGPVLTKYDYASTSVAGRLGRPTSLDLGRGADVTITYDERLQPVRFVRGDFEQLWAYDENGNPVFLSQTATEGRRYQETRKHTQISFLREVIVHQVETDGLQQDLVTTFTPDASWRIAKMTHPDGAETAYTYDPLGHVRTVTKGSYVEQYDRDLHGNVTGIHRGGDIVRRFRFDGHDRVITIENRLESATETTTIEYFPEGQQRSLTVTDPAYATVYHQQVDALDSLGRPLTETLSGQQTNATRQFAYRTDPTGLFLDISGPVDLQKFHYDTAGRLVSHETAAGLSTYTYDANGNLEKLESTEEGAHYLTEWEYDDLDHPTEAGDSLGHRYTFSPAPDGSIAQITDARGGTIQQQFSVLGELLAVTRANGVAFRHAYDPRRRLSFIGDPTQGYRYGYDLQTGRLSHHALRDGTKFEYPTADVRLNPVHTTLPGGQGTSRYDWQSRLSSMDITGTSGARFVATFSHDALGRVRQTTYGAAGENRATYTYDPLGPLTEAMHEEEGVARSIHYTFRPDSTRSSVQYPSGLQVTEGRGADGRLLTVAAGDPLYQILSYSGVGMPAHASIGNGLIRESIQYDLRRRLLARRYERISDNTLLCDVRYHYDATDNPLARQELHRHGRADLYRFDAGHRLTRVEMGARPEIAGAAPRSATGLSGGLGFQPGLHARSYAYDTEGLDLLESVTTANPDALAIAPFAATRLNPDGLLHFQEIDGFDRGPAAARGNLARTLLQTRGAGAAAPTPVAADLEYDGLSRLVRVTRADGYRVEYEYRPNGLLHRRRVFQGGSTLSDRAWVYDHRKLIEEYEDGNLAARYFYADSDSPFAADLRQAGGSLDRFYLLQDALGSIVAVANQTGEVIERITYDPWGQATLSGPDTAPPAISRIEMADGGVLRVTFTERIQPSLVNNALGSGLVTSTIPWQDGTAGAIQLADAQGPVSVTLQYLEVSRSDLGFGTTVALTPTRSLSGLITLSTAAGVFVDEWSLVNARESLPLTVGPPGSVLYQGPAPGSTAAPQSARSQIGLPILFQGHYQDYDAGLLYLKSRFYDPFTGTFLQLDPADYQDSVNLYAGFANNPVVNVDPSGTRAVSARMRKASGHAPRGAGSDDVGKAVARHAKKPGLGDDAAAVQKFRFDDDARPLLQNLGMTDREIMVMERILARRTDDWRMSIRTWRDPSARRALADAGLRAKPAHAKAKTVQGRGTVRQFSQPGRSGGQVQIGEYDVVSDMDLLHVSVNGRMATKQEFRKFWNEFNLELRNAGGRPAVMHGFQTQLGDDYGEKFLGKTIDFHYLEKVGDPGDSFTITSSGGGGVLRAFKTPRHQTDADILEAEGKLKLWQEVLGEERAGFPPNWHGRTQP